MKRLPLVLLAIVLPVVAVLLALAWAPVQVEQAWRGLGLPADQLQKLIAWLPDGAAARVAVPEEHSAVLIASGTLQAEETQIAAELSGQVAQVLVEEGQAVDSGQVLVRMDDSILRAHLAEADQAVQTAKADLTLARSGARPSAIDTSEAALRQAIATRDGAEQGLVDARRARDELQELDRQIHAAQSQVALAQRQVEQARARQAAIGVRRESVAGDGSDQGQTQRAMYDRQWAASSEGIAAAEQVARGSQRVVSFLQKVRNAPVTMDAAVHAAEGKVTLAGAGVRAAESALALASVGPRAEAIALAEAKLMQAEAAAHILRVQGEKAVISSPLSGIVTSRSIHTGEVTSPGVPLLVIADLSQITLVVYVPEPRLGEVYVGQDVAVTVDAFPERVFRGVVTLISPRAEFTPKTIQTQEERVETVFAVEVKLDNVDGALKPGMPADAEFEQR